METLSPSIYRNKKLFFRKFKNEKLEMISKKLDQLFDVEKDPVKRIMLLASRVETIRKRIEQINKMKIKTLKIVENSNVEDENKLKEENTEKNEKTSSESWVRVIMKESTEVNGVRFPEGIQIDVTEDDSKKLIDSGKAAIIS